MNVVSGHSLSNEALECAQQGAIRGIMAVDRAIEWAKSALEFARDGSGDGGERWAKSMSRINLDALITTGLIVRSIVRDHNLDVGVSEEEANEDSEEGDEGEGRVVLDNVSLQQAREIGADVRVWAALSSELRNVLTDERVLGISSGEHSNGEFWQS